MKQNHAQVILDNLVSGIIAIDIEDKITVFNQAAENILGFKAGQVLGKEVRILQENLVNLLLDTLHRDKSYRREEVSVLPGNNLVGVSTSQFFDAQGNLRGACMVFSSIAEIKRRERTLRQQDLDSYWSNIANSLAHEVKNSIVATKVFTELLPEKYDDAEFRGSLYSTLKRDMEKLDNFTERVLKFTQPKQLSLQSYDIAKVVDAAMDSAVQNRNIGEITFEKKYSPILQPLPGDYHQLKEALTQVISNALEAMGREGTLSISIEQKKSLEMSIDNVSETARQLPADSSIVVVKIADTGCGILPQNMRRLFDPFFTTKEAKTGLGLAFARKIIERHQGIISAESKPGEGSTFWVCLPVLVRSNSEVNR